MIRSHVTWFSRMSGAILFVLFAVNPLQAAENIPPILLQTPDLPLSELIDRELEALYNSTESITLSGLGAIAPWKDARVMMKALRNSVENIQVQGVNRNLYLQGLYSSTPTNNTTPEREIVVDHFTIYCAESANNERINYPGKCQFDPRLQHADIKLTTVLSGSRYENERRNAARLFIDNVIAPFPSEKLSMPSATKPEQIASPQSRKGIAESLANEAVLSVAREPFAEMFAKRNSIAELNNRSLMEIMEKEAGQRFLNEAWQAEMREAIRVAKADKKPQEAILYELAVMEAYRTWLEYERYRQTERIEALLAATLAFNQRQGLQASGVVQTAQSQGTSTSAPAGDGTSSSDYDPGVD